MIGNRVRIHATTALVATLLLSVIPVSAAAQEGSPPLFSSSAERPGPGPRVRNAVLQFDLRDAAGELSINLNLFDDTSAHADLTPSTAPNGVITWRGGDGATQVRLTTTPKGFVSGSVRFEDQRVFTIRGRAAGTVRIRQAPDIQPELLEPIPTPPSTAAPQLDSTSGAAADSAPVVIAHLIVMTDDVLAEEFGGNLGEAEAWMTDRETEFNDVLAASGATTRVELVGAEVVSYSETGDILTDLNKLTFTAGETCDSYGICDPAGALDGVHTTRDTLAADVVTLVVSNSTVDAGVGWLTCAPGSSCVASRLFNVARFDAADTYFTIPHEVGHNAGLRHDRANDDDPPDTYARGHRNTSFATVMSYGCTLVEVDPGVYVCSDTNVGRIGHYSNPNVSYAGKPTGVAIGQPDQAFAVAHIDAIAAQVAAARELVVSQPIGLVDPNQGRWYLRDGAWSTDFYFGNPNDVPFMGDWNCDGIDTPGLYRRSDGYVYLRNSNTQGPADITFFFGNPGDIPIAGNFDGVGCDTVSLYRPSEGRFYIINELGEDGGGLGAADFSYLFGNIGDKPFVGDFDGDGIDTIGLHRESTGSVYFRNSHTQGNADHLFYFGNSGDRLIAGDWNKDGSDSPAVYRPSTTTFYFRYTNTQGVADEQTSWGQSTWLPVTGDRLVAGP